MVKRFPKTVKCHVCGCYRAKNLTTHLRRAHKLTHTQYKKKYFAEVISEGLREALREAGHRGNIRNYNNDFIKLFRPLTPDQKVDVIAYVAKIKSRKGVLDYYEEIKEERDGEED